jgi:hypothetical protein
MQYKCIRGVITSQGPISEGEIVTLPASEAVLLMHAGKLAIHAEVRVAAPPKVEHRDPVVKAPSKNGR